ncbi:MAG: alpha/beta fold hydrolase [Lachnospiraceae bacterium]|nr:alpha/beta fold hydrolase [Lachnospiraceae bacterium]
MKKEEFYYASRDEQSKIHAVRYTPEGVEPWCVVQIVHGMAEHIERYEAFAKFLTDRGIVVTGASHLGHGKSVGEGQVQGYFCKVDPATVVVRDVHRLKKMTENIYPNLPYFILGHSMGSFITRNYISRYGTGIKGAIIMASGVMPIGMIKASKALMSVIGKVHGEKYVSKFCDNLAFGNYNARIENPKTSVDWLSTDEKEVQKYIDDPMCGFTFTINGFKGLMELMFRAHAPEYLEKVPGNLPLYVVAGEEDPVGSYGLVVTELPKLLAQFGVTNIEAKGYKNARHEILNDVCREEVMEDIYAWLKKEV